MPKIKKKYKTFTFFIKDDDVVKNKIFDIMCNDSRSIYNRTLFCYNIYKYFENEIFDFVYLKVTNNEKLLKSLKKRESSSTHDVVNGYIDIIFNEKYKFYAKHYNLFKKNNTIIYSFIKETLKDTIIDNFNYDDTKEKIIKKIIAKKLVDFDSDNKDLVLIEVVTKILKSFYNSVYFKTKFEMLAHEPYTFNVSKEFISCIKNNNYLFEKSISSLDKLRKLNISLNEANIVRHCTYINLEGDFKKLPSNVIIGIIDKTFEGIISYYVLRKKGKTANKPSFLSPTDKYVLPFFNKSFKKTDTIEREKSQIRLTVGKHIAGKIKEIIGDNVEMYKNKYYYLESTSKIKKEKTYIKLNEDTFLNKNNLLNGNFMFLHLHKKIRNEMIQLIEVVPTHGKYKVCVTYKDQLQYPAVFDHTNKTEKELAKESVSIDLGVVNLFTIYDPMGNAIIIKGNVINGINNKYKNLISQSQSVYEHVKTTEIKEKIKKEIHTAWINRKNKKRNTYCVD